MGRTGRAAALRLPYEGSTNPEDMWKMAGGPGGRAAGVRRTFAQPIYHEGMSALILIVEDEPQLAEVLEAYVRQEDYRTERAADGQTALTIYRAAHPDLILLDIMLPGRNGLEVLKTVRADGSTPVILVTARAEERGGNRPDRRPGARGGRLRGQALPSPRGDGADQGRLAACGGTGRRRAAAADRAAGGGPPRGLRPCERAGAWATPASAPSLPRMEDRWMLERCPWEAPA